MAPQANSRPAYLDWQNNTSEKWWTDPGLKKLGWICIIMYLGVYTQGYDGSYLSGLQALDTWNDYFGTPSGWKLGLISASAYIPAVVTGPAAGWLCDRFGRKPTIALGCVIVVAGALIGCFANGLGMLIAGRAIVGGGSYFASVGCVCMLNELLHPRLRHIASALYFSTYYIGGIVASWTTFGCVYWPSNWGWRLPTLLQALGPAIILGGLLITPESPRWLMAQGREDEARKILELYHANGATNDELVHHEMEEMAQAIQFDREESQGWMAFFATAGNRRRLLVVVLASSGAQWSGLSVISYYLAVILRSVGYTSSAQIAGINGGLNVYNWLFAILGAVLVERVGRRPLWLISTGSMCVFYVIFTALSGVFQEGGSNPQVGAAVVAFIFLFNGAYDIAWTPLSYSYPSEILPTSLRASGMGIFSLVQALCVIFSQLVNSIALDAIAYRYYFVWLACLFFYMIMVYFFFVETKGYTSEEVGALFDGNADAVLVAGLTGRETAIKDTSKDAKEQRFLEVAPGDDDKSSEKVSNKA